LLVTATGGFKSGLYPTEQQSGLWGITEVNLSIYPERSTKGKSLPNELADVYEERESPFLSWAGRLPSVGKVQVGSDLAAV
jgi:hypothetical protein